LRTEDWLKPVMLLVGIFAFVYFLMILSSGGYFGVTSDVYNPIVNMIPWFIALGMVILTIIFVLRRR